PDGPRDAEGYPRRRSAESKNYERAEAGMRQTGGKKKVALVSLWCSKNQVDSEVMLGLLKQDGFELTLDTEKAEVIIVNTCGFIDAAKEESVDTLIELGKLKKKSAG